MPGPLGHVVNSPDVDGGTSALCASRLPGCLTGETQGNSDISIGDGKKIVKEAATWAGTPYKKNGAAASKGADKGGDCSGTTYRIYAVAGFPFTYNATATFAKYAKTSGRFRIVDTATEEMQVGDLLLFAEHMAIYAAFANGDANSKTERTNKSGKGSWSQSNDIWTATNPKGDPYQASKMSYFGVPRVYRYQKVPRAGK